MQSWLQAWFRLNFGPVQNHQYSRFCINIDDGFTCGHSVSYSRGYSLAYSSKLWDTENLTWISLV